MLPNEPYKRFAVITLYVTVGIAVIYIIFNCLFGAILPFLIAYLFAECFRPIVKYSESNKKFPKRSFVLFVILLATVALIGLVYAIARRVYFEIGELSVKVREMVTMIRTDDGYAEDTINKLCDMIPFVDLRDKMWEIRNNLDEELWGLFLSFGDKLSGGLVAVVGSVAAFLPNALFTLAVIIIATYYFAIDRVRINCFLLSLFPKKLRDVLKGTKDSVSETVVRYIRAFGLIFCITFAELLIAFMIMGINYSFVLALITAIVDVLPVLGTGTVLLPWAIISLIIGNYPIGIGLIITYIVITVVRQILEPKIIGKFIGLSPLASLASMYIGLELIGILGIFVFPLGAILLKRILDERKNQAS